MELRTEIDVAWETIRGGLNQIYDHKENLKADAYIQLYTTVFNFCTRAVNQEADRSEAPTEILGNEMYNHLCTYVTNRVGTIATKLDGLRETDLLTMYARLWTDFQFSAHTNNGVFSYLNRHWIKHENEASKAFEVYDLAVSIWRKSLFDKLHPSLTAALLCLIQKSRNGEQVTTQLLRDVIFSYLEMGHNETVEENSERVSSVDDPNHKMYKRCFEVPFLERTREFYARESAEFLQTHSIVEYMRMIEQRIKEEVERCSLHLSKISVEPLTKTLQDVLIVGRLPLFEEEFDRLLKEQRIEDLGRMYNLCVDVEGACDPLHKSLQKYVTDKGYEAVKSILNVANKEPRQYIDTILKIHTQFNDLVTRAFKYDLNFVRSMDKAFVEVVNDEKVVRQTTPALKIPELLSRYCDRLLRKGQKNAEQAELDSQLSKAITVYKYLADKDAFMAYYVRMLARRLIGDLSTSDEAESLMLTKLRETSGSEYTRKLHRMFNDANVSREVSEEFRKDKSSEDCIDTSMMVLTTGVWPMKTGVTFELPSKLKHAMDQCVKFYQSRHTGRLLKYAFRESRGEMATRCFKRKYTFVATLAQISILHLFNNTKSLTFAQIQEQSKMEKELVVSALHGIVKAGVLNVTEGNVESYCAVLILNEDFESKKLKVNLTSYVAKPEARKEAEQIQREIEDDHQHVIQAALVRIMKTRKTLKHSLLVSEVISQLTPRFNPTIPNIKKSIGVLIEREYIKRQMDNVDVIEYIS